LRRAIGREEFDHPLLVSALSQYEAVPQKINELLKAETIVRVKKGLYIFGPRIRQQPIAKESLANLIYGPSCISMEYALSYHGLIPERVEIVTSVTSKKNKEFNTPIGLFTYKHLPAAKYPHGIEQSWIDAQHPVLIASPEKALCDYIISNGVSLTTSSSVKNFLEFDLRIDPESWQRFDLKQLLLLNKYYKSKSLVALMEAM
jgi:predicted transcriptional regulator of viral defense system